MPAKILTRQILLTGFIVLVVLAVFFWYLVPVSSFQIKPIKQAPIINKIIATSTSEQTSFGLPNHLDISKINLSADLEYVGLTPEGAMDTPQNQNKVAWLKIGPRPGETGSAVMAGHYGWKGGKPSAFDNLYKLRQGDKILIKDEAGAIITFIVRAIKRYSPGANATDVFISSDGKSHLNLITCEGVWDKASKSYSTRLVIFADKETK